MTWIKKKSGIAASISNENYLCHRSIKTPEEITVTVCRRKPFKVLGSAAGFQEAIKMCEDDANE